MKKGGKLKHNEGRGVPVTPKNVLGSYFRKNPLTVDLQWTYSVWGEPPLSLSLSLSFTLFFRISPRFSEFHLDFQHFIKIFIISSSFSEFIQIFIILPNIQHFTQIFSISYGFSEFHLDFQNST